MHLKIVLNLIGPDMLREYKSPRKFQIWSKFLFGGYSPRSSWRQYIAINVNFGDKQHAIGSPSDAEVGYDQEGQVGIKPPKLKQAVKVI